MVMDTYHVRKYQSIPGTSFHFTSTRAQFRTILCSKRQRDDV